MHITNGTRVKYFNIMPIILPQRVKNGYILLLEQKIHLVNLCQGRLFVQD